MNKKSSSPKSPNQLANSTILIEIAESVSSYNQLSTQRNRAIKNAELSPKNNFIKNQEKKAKICLKEDQLQNYFNDHIKQITSLLNLPSQRQLQFRTQEENYQSCKSLNDKLAEKNNYPVKNEILISQNQSQKKISSEKILQSYDNGYNTQFLKKKSIDEYIDQIETENIYEGKNGSQVKLRVIDRYQKSTSTLPKPKLAPQEINQHYHDYKVIKNQNYYEQINNSSTKGIGKLKLRDYLYITNINSKQKNNCSPQQGESCLTKNFKKSKYNISNKEIEKILSKDIYQDIQEIQSNLNKIIRNFEPKQCNDSEPSDSEMLLKYTIRRMMKDNILKMTKDIRQLLKKDINIIESLKSLNLLE